MQVHKNTISTTEIDEIFYTYLFHILICLILCKTTKLSFRPKESRFNHCNIDLNNYANIRYDTRPYIVLSRIVYFCDLYRKLQTGLKNFFWSVMQNHLNSVLRKASSNKDSRRPKKIIDSTRKKLLPSNDFENPNRVR